jgi:hypothetical protein
MVKLTVDEAYAFDYYSILSLKCTNGYVSLATLDLTKRDLEQSLGEDLVRDILNSEEYHSLLTANRMLAKKSLQNKFFNTELTEVKVGYEKLKT